MLILRSSIGLILLDMSYYNTHDIRTYTFNLVLFVIGFLVPVSVIVYSYIGNCHNFIFHIISAKQSSTESLFDIDCL